MICLQTLGALEIRHADGLPVTAALAQPRRLALLVYLASARAVERPAFQRRDTLLALLWPQADEHQARTSLNAAIYFLRRCLGEGVIVSRGPDELGVDPTLLVCDIAAFEGAIGARHFEEAVGWYRGAFLDGFHISKASAYEEWMERERGRLASCHRHALEQLATTAHDRGDWSAATGWGRQRAAADPLSSRAAEALIRTLIASGDRAGALQYGRVHEALMRQELGTDPEEAMVALVRSLREQPSRVAVHAEAPLIVAATDFEGAEHGDVHPPSHTGGLPELLVVGFEQQGTDHAVELATASASGALPASQQSGLSLLSPVTLPSRSLRRWRLPASLVLAAGGAIGLWTMRSGVPRDPTLVANRVLVAAFDNRTDDTTLAALGGLAADWITMGIQESGLAEVIDPATAFMYTRDHPQGPQRSADVARVQALAHETGAGLVVWGAYYRTADSLQFSVHLTDVARRTNWVTILVSGPMSNHVVVVRELRARVAGALASRLDPQLASLVAASGEPPRLAAYQEYISGLERYQRQDYEAAFPRFTRASDLDSSFMLPRLWAVMALADAGRRNESDSLLRTIVANHPPLARLDQFALDALVADHGNDQDALDAALRGAARLAPKSNWTLMLADRLGYDHRYEAVRLLESLDPDHGWVRGWSGYYEALAYWCHAAEEYQKEVSASARIESPDPHSVPHNAEIRVLAATGHTLELRAVVDGMIARWRAAGSPDGVLVPDSNHTADRIAYAAIELLVHGHPAEAQQTIMVAQDVQPIPALGNTPLEYTSLIMDEQPWGKLATLLASPSPWLAKHPEDRVHYRHFLALRALHVGDRVSAARITATLLDSLPREYNLAHSENARRGSFLLQQAGLRAQLGDKAEAVRLLEMAVGRGIDGNVLHWVPAFESLRDYPPYVELRDRWREAAFATRR